MDVISLETITIGVEQVCEVGQGQLVHSWRATMIVKPTNCYTDYHGMRYSCVKWVSNCAAAAPPQLANVADAEMSRRKI